MSGYMTYLAIYARSSQYIPAIHDILPQLLKTSVGIFVDIAVLFVDQTVGEKEYGHA